MKKEAYISVINYLKERDRLLKTAVFLQKAAEIFVYIAYPLFLAWLAYTKNPFLIRSAVTCAIGFVAVSVIRRAINAERPYVKYGFTPLIKKETAGNSMPSRHCFSAAVIAVNIGAVFLPLGIVLGIIALIIAALRVILGVHFIKDVAVGLLSGVLVGVTVFI